MEPLTKAEEQVMRYLWKLGKGFFKDIKDQYPEPQPATTTINTLIKRLINKKYVSYTLYGNSREYFPLISKHQYFSKHVRGLIDNFFNNSVEQFGSFFTKEIDMSEEELKNLRDIIDKQLNDTTDD